MLEVRPHRFRLSLLLRALILVLATTLIPLAILGTIGRQRAMEALGGSARRDIQAVAELTATRLDQLFTDTQRMQGIIANNPTIIAGLGKPADQIPLQDFQALLDSIIARNPDLALAYLADAQGVCRAATSPNMVGRDYRGTREYMRRALAGEQYVSELNMGITTGEPGVFFSGPVRRNSEVIGAAVLKLKGEVIDRICHDVSANLAHGIAAVTDSRQVLISHPDKGQLYHSIGSLPPEVASEINPKLDYGVEAVESLGLEDVARQLRLGYARGNLTFPTADDVNVVGYARLKQKPWTLLVIQPRSVFVMPLNELTNTFVIAFAIIGAASALLAVFATWRLLRPVKALKTAAVKAGNGDWSARAEVLSHDELGDLARVFNEMMPKLQQQTRMQHALNLAMEVQRHLLPEHGPTILGLDTDGVNVAADETGGDYFDFLDLSDWQGGSLAIAVGDVTGHGISAALLMATARGMVRSRATPMGGLAELMTNVNAHLCDDVPTGQFMTLMYAVVDRPRKQLRLVSAGHDPILAYNPQTDEFRDLGGTDLPLGIERDWVFHEHLYQLEDDSILVLGTDGIWETFSPDGEPFGIDRLKEAIRANAQRNARGLKQGILDAVSAFRGSGPQQDDVTVVVVRIMPMGAADALIEAGPTVAERDQIATARR